MRQPVEERAEVELPRRACPDCGEEMATGFWFGERPVYSHLKSCTALAARLAEEDAARMQSALWALREREAHLPGDGEAVDLESFTRRFTVDKHNRKALEALGRFVEAVKASALLPKSGIALHGEYGCGKTTLLIAAGRSLARGGVGVRFENVPELMGHLRAAVKSGSLEGRLEKLQRVPVLILDDLGREQPTPFSVDQVLYPLIDERYRYGRPVLLTTNFTQAQLETRYSAARNERGDEAANAAAIMDRLRQRCPWLPVGGGSRREATLDF